MTAAGLIFSNIHDQSIRELTQNRTMASVPFGCRYRLIDFALSNMVNSDITKVGIITHNNYQSLFDHIGNGKDWDLARRSGGIKILPPFISSYSSPMHETLYSTRLEALMGVMGFIKNCKEDHLVLSDCDVICNINLADVLKFHEENKADITVVSTDYRFGDAAHHSNIVKLESDGEGRLLGLTKEKPTDGVQTISSNIMVVTRKDKHVFGIVAIDKFDVLVNSVCRSLVPVRGILSLVRGQNGYTAKGSVKIPREAVSNILIEDQGLILCKDTNGVKSGIDAVGKRKINDAILSSKGYGRLGDFICESIKSAALTSCKKHYDTFFFLKHKRLRRYIFF